MNSGLQLLERAYPARIEKLSALVMVALDSGNASTALAEGLVE